MKKNWEKPELIVLVRGAPDEAVLTACKLKKDFSSGPQAENNECKLPTSSTVDPCDKCSATADS